MKPSGQLGFYLDTSACIGCKACQIACKDKNHLPVGVNWRRVTEYSGGEWKVKDGFLQPVGVYAYHLSVACMHCEEPACVAVCPAQAIRKTDDGVVINDPSQCSGCASCWRACPYDTPQFGRDGIGMSKCDFCPDLISSGQNPACVDACPMRALDWGELSYLREKYGNLSAIKPLPAPSQGPALILTPHRHAVS